MSRRPRCRRCRWRRLDAASSPHRTHAKHCAARSAHPSRARCIAAMAPTARAASANACACAHACDVPDVAAAPAPRSLRRAIFAVSPSARLCGDRGASAETTDRLIYVRSACPVRRCGARCASRCFLVVRSAARCARTIARVSDEISRCPCAVSAVAAALRAGACARRRRRRLRLRALARIRDRSARLDAKRAELTGREFDLSIGEMPVELHRRDAHRATVVNGQLPAPLLRWREGDTVTLRVRNTLPTRSSIHWHGIVAAGRHGRRAGPQLHGHRAGRDVSRIASP